MNQKTKVYVSFFGMEKGKPGWPNIDFDPEARGKELLQKVKEISPDIEFIGGDMILDFAELRKVEQRADLGGILVYTLAMRPAGLLSWCFRKNQDLSLFRRFPMIIADDLYGGEEMLLDFYDVAKKNNLPIIAVMSSDLADLESALYLIKVIHRVKAAKILDITDGKDLGGQSGWWGQDAQNYFRQLKETFGLEVVTVGSRELNDCYQNVNEKSAAELADKWINGAVKVVEPSREEIIKSGKIYLAIKELMKANNADAVTVDCLGLYYAGKFPAYPCLTFMELLNQGITGICESDLEATVTHFVMSQLTGRAGFVSDPVLDTAAGQIIYAHCTAPTKVFGPNGPTAPYILRTHAEDKKGACPQVIMPVGKPITTVKINTVEKKIPFIKEKAWEMLITTGAVARN